MTSEELKQFRADTLLKIISKRSSKPVEQIRLSDQLVGDLGLDGDDADDLLIDVHKQLEVEIGDFDFSRHFYDETQIA